MPLMASSNKIGQAAGWRRLRAMVNEHGEPWASLERLTGVKIKAN